MVRIYGLFLLLFIFKGAVAQSTLTLSLDGNGYTHIGGRLRTAVDLPGIQLAAYGSALIAWPFDKAVSEFAGVAGFSINTTPGNRRDISLYGGGSAEVLFLPYALDGAGVTDVAYLAGPQLGLRIKLGWKVFLNTEWGARAGIMLGNERVAPNTIVEDNYFYYYFPSSIGVTYKFGR